MSKRPKASRPSAKTKDIDTRLAELDIREREIKLAHNEKAESAEDAASKQAEEDCEVLGFDFDDISMDDADRMADLFSQVYTAKEDGDKEALDEARLEMREFLARIVTHIPDDWFVSSLNGAVKDFNDPLLYGKVKTAKSLRLIRAMNYSMGEAQKN